MIATAKKLTPAERLPFLREHYADKGAAWCAERLGVSIAAIHVQCSSHGIRRRRIANPKPVAAPKKRGRPRKHPRKPPDEATGWQQYIASGRRDMELRNYLLSLYQKSLSILAMKLSRKLCGEVSAEDLAQDGWPGMAEAAQRFDPARGLKFWTYAMPRVRGAMLDAVRVRDRISRTARKVERVVNERKTALRSTLLREPTDDDLVEAGVTVIQLRSRPPQLTSLDIDGPGNDKYDHGPSLRKSLALACGPLGEGAQQRTDQFFREMTRKLSMEQQTIIYLYLVADSTMKDIGKILSLSESRVSQLISQSLETLRRELNRDEAWGVLAIA